MDSVVITCIICLSVLVALIVTVLVILVYNQMLITNEVNKRLLLIAKESIDKERSSTEELNEALRELDRVTNEVKEPSMSYQEEDEEVFNPHTYTDNVTDL